MLDMQSRDRDDSEEDSSPAGNRGSITKTSGQEDLNAIIHVKSTKRERRELYCISQIN